MLPSAPEELRAGCRDGTHGQDFKRLLRAKRQGEHHSIGVEAVVACPVSRCGYHQTRQAGRYYPLFFLCHPLVQLAI